VPAAETGTAGVGRVEIWLQLTCGELATLADHPPPGWRHVINELTASTAGQTGPPNGDPTARIPGELLRRWVNARDLSCVHPGCRVPAHRTEADHTVEYAAGGPTIDTNLGSCCGPHHALRHKRGWHLSQPSVGRFVWTSPLGHHYERVRPRVPQDAAQPLARPTRPDEDNFSILTLGTWDGPDTYEIIGRPRPPNPAVPAPADHRADEVIPF
jgi:hypothetical protein